MNNKITRMNIALALLSPAWAAQAGRPLSVDDASVDSPQTGHVEVSYTRDVSGANSVNIVPAFSPFKGIELDGLLSRDTTNKVNTLGVQIKALFSESQKNGCNFGGTLGVSRSEASGAAKITTPSVNGIFTCNQADFALHINAGATRPEGDKTKGTWGVAVEESVSKDLSGHLEAFGQQGNKPTVQFGLKTQLGSMQLDATMGRNDGKNLYSLGVKFNF